MSRTETIPYDPLPVFKPFHECTAEQAAVIGGYGSGKSHALCAEAVAAGLEQPGSEWLIARATVPSLRDTTEAMFFDLLTPEFLKECKTSRMGGHYESIVFPNHSKFYFRGLDDWRKLKSLTLAGFFLDEADETTEETYDGLISRVRQTRPRGDARRQGAQRINRRMIRLACNPAGRNWIWERFVRDANSNRVGFISTTLDNPHNPISYVNMLLSYPEPWVRRYVLSSFDDFQGVIYPEWDYSTHVIKPYSRYDAGGWFWMGMDPGTAHPTAGIWCYYDRKIGKLVGVAEYAETDLAVAHHVAAWRKIEAHGTHNLSRTPGRMNVVRRIADPTIATRDRGTMNSLEQQYNRRGYYFEHGPKNVPDRLPMLGSLIHEGRFVVTQECEQAYEQIKNYRYEDLTPAQNAKGVEAKPLKKNVDIVDTAQYAASRFNQEPTLPVKDKDEKPEPDGWQMTSQEAIATIRSNIQHRQTVSDHDLGGVPV